MKEARRHHFVPKLLLRPWLVETSPGQQVLCGYWWSAHSGSLKCKLKGLDAFCFQLDLLTLSSHHLGRDAVERIFFGEIDDKGAQSCELIKTGGLGSISWEQRCDFVRLLLSLEARRPVILDQLRRTGAAQFRDGLDNDLAIREAFRAHGIQDNPSHFVERSLGWSLEDYATLIVQRLVDNADVGGRLAKAHWGVKKLGYDDGTLVLSDRPLIRVGGYSDPAAVWGLPLTPKIAFVAANHRENFERMMRTTAQRFAKKMNVSSVMQAERFVFAVDQSHRNWLGKHLRRQP